MWVVKYKGLDKIMVAIHPGCVPRARGEFDFLDSPMSTDEAGGYARSAQRDFGEIIWGAALIDDTCVVCKRRVKT